MTQKIKTSDLSKTALVDIVDALREAKAVPETFIEKLYKYDLALQLASIEKQLKNIKAKLKNKKISRKAYVNLVKKNNQLVGLADRKANVYNGLSNDTDR